MFIIRWIYAFSDYLSEVIDDILHNNWFVCIFKLVGLFLEGCLLNVFLAQQARDDASSVSYLLCFVHLVWNCGHPGLQVREATTSFVFGWGRNESFVFCSDSSEDNQTKAKAKEGTKAENGSPRGGSAPRQEQEQDSPGHVTCVAF